MTVPLSPAVRRWVETAGYDVTGAGPPVATPTGAAASPFPRTGRDATGPVPFELHGFETPPEPWRVVATLAGALRRGRAVAFVTGGPAPAVVEDRVASVLESPLGVEREAGDGARTFYDSPDRVHLAGGGLALVRERAGTWREETLDGEARRLVLADGDRTVVVLDGVDALRCPGPDRGAFPLSYRREDRRFVVRDRDGRRVGAFAGVRAMRDRGFVPVPAPVVPEHEFPAPGEVDAGGDVVDPPSPSSAWAVLDPDAGTVRTATGQRSSDGSR